MSYHLVRDRWITRATEWVLYAAAWTLRWITWPIGTWTLTGTLGRMGGWVLYRIPGLRRRAEQNLDLVWPDLTRTQRNAIIKGAARHFSCLSVEYARLDKVIRDVQIDAQGLDVLRAAQAAGKGAVLVSAHYGNWEAARLAALQAGCETGIIYRAFNNRYLDRFTLNLIPCCGTPVLQKGRQGMRQLVTHVARGGFVMILVDQRNSGAPFLDFLGKPAETVTAAADLAHRTGAALIPARAMRNFSDRRFDVTFEELELGETPLATMQAVNDRIGAWVTEHPEQWFWFHRRWRSTIRSRPKP